jgi:hypothetical protein
VESRTLKTRFTLSSSVFHLIGRDDFRKLPKSTPNVVFSQLARLVSGDLNPILETTHK